MMPEEWPIAATAADDNAPARRAGRGRLGTVRADFFLDPAERLTEQERALMTAMLHCLVADLADRLRAALPLARSAANDQPSNLALIDALSAARLLDEPMLMALLLRRADEERIVTAASARGGKREARVLQGLVSHDDGAVSAAAMALILARGRRRDRFGQCLLGFEDLPAETAATLIHRIAAALRSSASGRARPSDADLAAAALALLATHDRALGIDRLSATLVGLLDQAGDLSDQLLLAAAHEGELRFVAQALAVRAGIGAASAEEELLSGSPDGVIALLRVAQSSRTFAAGLLASVGDLIGIADPGQSMALFDSLSDDQATAARAWLGTSPDYRAALAVLDGDRG